MKEIQFPAVGYEQWKEHATKALKGKPFESLFTATTEGVELQPLYTKERLENLDVQLESQVSAVRSLKETPGYKVAQQVYGDTPAQFFSCLKDSLDKGNEVLAIDSRVPFSWDEETLETLAAHLSEHPFKLTVANQQDPLLNVFGKITDPNVTGYIISNEPVAMDGFLKVKSISANLVPYHYEGAHAIQELALALALASKYAEEEGNFEQFIDKFFVHFAIDTQFFSEIAKLRAFKVVWKAFTSAYGVKVPAAIPVLAETSVRSFSKLDVYVNLLRAGNEAFSALIGGADVFTVHPHDCLTNPTDQSIRIARNVSLVLKEESYVGNVLDPSGGSYFIETLTAEYAEKAWELFLEIEEAGGIDAFSASGKLQTALDVVYKGRLQKVKTRNHSLIGTNIYANPVDELQEGTNKQFSQLKRLAIPFEILRSDYRKADPKIALLTFGQLKDFKGRADFVTGFFAVAGIAPEQSGEIQSVDEAKQWIESSTADYVVIAAKDEDAKSLVPVLLQHKPDSLLLDVAGKFPDEREEWTKGGLNGFIMQGQDIVEKLAAVIERVKGVKQ